MLWLVLITLTLFISKSYGVVNTFFPPTLTSEETSCSNGKSWTMWFNTGKPSSLNGDKEITSIVKEMHSLHVSW